MTRPAGRWLPTVIAALLFVRPVMAGPDTTERSLRERSTIVARTVLAHAGSRFLAPVRLEVVDDSTDAVLGGFTEAFSQAGFVVRLADLPPAGGTLVRVRRVPAEDGSVEGLDVRVEQWPERSVLYSRLWWSGTETSEEEEGLLERLLVPVTVGAAAALVIFLFFTVRS